MARYTLQFPPSGRPRKLGSRTRSSTRGMMKPVCLCKINGELYTACQDDNDTNSLYLKPSKRPKSGQQRLPKKKISLDKEQFKMLSPQIHKKQYFAFTRTEVDGSKSPFP